MANIELKNVRKSYGRVEVIKGVDLEIHSGEFMVFVGPSGCGKSTLLRLISGLGDITSGDLLFDGVRVNNKVPSERGIAMVFQSYALYPHMKCLQEPSLRPRDWRESSKRPEIDKRVRRQGRRDAADRPTMLDRLPEGSFPVASASVLPSGGRSIVTRSEHLSVSTSRFPTSTRNLRVADARSKDRQLLHERARHVTMIYVTHDQVEAMTHGRPYLRSARWHDRTGRHAVRAL